MSVTKKMIEAGYEDNDYRFWNEFFKEKREANWNEYQEKLLPLFKEKLSVKEFKWHCQITTDKLIVDYYPKKNRICVREEGVKGHKWLNQGLEWIFKNLLK